MRHQSHSEEREKQEAGGFILRSLLIGKQSEKDSVVQKKHHATVNNIKMWSRLSAQFLITQTFISSIVDSLQRKQTEDPAELMSAELTS